MSDVDRGPLETYEVVWMSGHVERIRAHQALVPSPSVDLLGGRTRRDRYTFHAELAGHWRLVLDADAADIRSVRLVTDGESLPSTQTGEQQ